MLLLIHIRIETIHVNMNEYCYTLRSNYDGQSEISDPDVLTIQVLLHMNW